MLELVLFVIFADSVASFRAVAIIRSIARALVEYWELVDIRVFSLFCLLAVSLRFMMVLDGTRRSRSTYAVCIVYRKK